MIKIGRLRVHLDTRELFRDGDPVRIGSRAFDILEMLIAADGTLVTKDQILERVWPDTIVEENNLQVHMSALRKLLGDDRMLIKTVPGRGYRFSLPSQEDDSPIASSDTVAAAGPTGSRPNDAEEGAADAQAAASRPAVRAVRTPSNLPASSSALIGREAEIDEATRILEGVRLLTLVGAGGIGKTRLGIEIGRQMLVRFPDGVYLVSLASATDMSAALDAFSTVLDAPSSKGALTLEKIIEALAERRVLLILDNCEHLLEVVAALAEAVLQANSGTRVLATSREPLRLAEETVFTVPTLQFPSTDDSGEGVLQCSAVRLFLSRARAFDPLFSSDPQSLLLTGTVCRRLDGIPLAIELAASRAAVLGIQTLAAHLDDRFRMLTGGHRTALPRHQTLKATLDWSYSFLDEQEQRMLRRLGVFSNGFTLGGAVAMMQADEDSADQVIDALSGLVSKSLVIAESRFHRKRYRLLETTRAYALQRLEDHAELRSAALQHARYMSDLLRRSARAEREARDGGDGRGPRAAMFDMELTRDDLDDIRSALRWAFSSRGDVQTGIALAADASHYFFDSSLVQECRDWAERALQAIVPDLPDNGVALNIRMKLLSAVGAALVYLNGPDARIRRLWSEVLALALAAGDRTFEARAIWGLWNEAQYSGEIDIALQHARRFRDLAVQLDDETNQLLAQRLLGISMHYAGDHKAALIHLQLMLARYDNSRHRLPILGASIDHSVVGRATMARVLWWLGRHDEALALSERVLREARDDGHAMMFCYVMVEATLPLALLAGKHPRALALIDELKVASNRAGFSIWSACCRCYAEYLAAASSPHEDRSGFYADALDMLEKTGFLSHAPMLQSGYALALAQSGDPAHASFVLNQTMARCRANGERWYDEELLATRQKVLSFADVADARWYQSDRADPTGPPTIAAHSLLHSAAMQDKNS